MHHTHALRRYCRHHHHGHRRNTPFTCTLSIIIAKHQYLGTTLTDLAADGMHTCMCICNSEYFIQSENSPSHISIDHVLFDFWCASDMLKIKCSENGFSSKNGKFLCIIVANMCQKDIIVFRFRFSLFLLGFEHREFRISCFKFECL